MMKTFTTKLNNGLFMPVIGLGTWKASKDDVTAAVEIAIKTGYRHIDCASDYENEENVGKGITSMVSSGVVKREDLFITTKLWNTFHKPEDVQLALESSLLKLGCGYVDLYLMHFPTGEDKSAKDFPSLSKDELHVSNVDYVDTWKAMEKLLRTGLVKAIGVSNFNEYQLKRIISQCHISPAVNQIENHPYLTEENLTKFCMSENIHVTAYSPLGSLDREWAKPNDPNLLNDKLLLTVAEKYNKSIAQVLLKFQIQRGLSVIPKSVSCNHIVENFQVFDFEIDESDMAAILALNRDWRALDISWISDNKYFPFVDNYSEN